MGIAGASGTVGVTGIAGPGSGGRVSRAFGEELKEGRPGTGWVGRALTGLRGPGACRGGLPPRDLCSLHLLGEDVSQPMAGPGAPSRPPLAAPHRPACRGARLSRGPAPGNIVSRGLAGLRSAPPAPQPRPLRRRRPQTTATVSGSAGPACSGAGSGRRRDPSAGSGVGAANTARAPVTAAEPGGACARRGRGARACVCVGARLADRRSRAAHFLSESVGTWRGKLSGGGLWPLGSPITSSTFFQPLHPPILLPTKTSLRKSRSN